MDDDLRAEINSTPINPSITVYGFAFADEIAFIKKISNLNFFLTPASSFCTYPTEFRDSNFLWAGACLLCVYIITGPNLEAH